MALEQSSEESIAETRFLTTQPSGETYHAGSLHHKAKQTSAKPIPEAASVKELLILYNRSHATAISLIATAATYTAGLSRGRLLHQLRIACTRGDDRDKGVEAARVSCVSAHPASRRASDVFLLVKNHPAIRMRLSSEPKPGYDPPTPVRNGIQPYSALSAMKKVFKPPETASSYRHSRPRSILLSGAEINRI